MPVISYLCLDNFHYTNHKVFGQQIFRHKYKIWSFLNVHRMRHGVLSFCMNTVYSRDKINAELAMHVASCMYTLAGLYLSL